MDKSQIQIQQSHNNIRMIQQQNANPYSNNPVSTRLAQLLSKSQPDRQAIREFIANLYEVETFQTQSSNLDVLVNCLIQYVGDDKNFQDGVIKNGDVIVVVLLCMLDQIRRLQYRIGTVQFAALIVQPKLRTTIRRILNQKTSSNSAKQLKSEFIIFFTIQNIKQIQQNLTNTRIQSQSNVVNLGLVYMLIAMLWYLKYLGKNDSLVGVDLVKEIIEKFGEEYDVRRCQKFSKQQLMLWVKMFVEFYEVCQRIKIQENKGYQFAWSAIVRLFQVDNLEKKLVALEFLDTLLILINSKNQEKSSNSQQNINANRKKQIRLTFRISNFLKQILQPRTHQQILSRSLNFLKYWLQNVQSQSDLQILRDWFIHLIIKSDLRTSNIFSACWQKLMMSIKCLGEMQIKGIYGIISDILNSFVDEGNNNQSQNKQTLSKNKQKAQHEQRIRKIITPILNHKIAQQPIHSQMDLDQSSHTLAFLMQIFEQKKKFSKNLQTIIDQCLQICISELVCEQFNLYCLQENVSILGKIVVEKKLIQMEENVVTFQQEITSIYTYLSTIVSSYNKNLTSSKLQNPELTRQAYINILIREQNILKNIIISHNTSNSQQLNQLLNLLSSIMQLVGDIQFQKEYIGKIIAKVSKSNQLFLEWLKYQLQSISNMEFKRKIIRQLFKDPVAFAQITSSSLQNLLSIFHTSDYKKQDKQQFCLQMIRNFKVQNSQQLINIILHSMYNQVQICDQKWLTQYMAPKISQLNFDDNNTANKQLEIYLQILQISQQFQHVRDDPPPPGEREKKDRVFGQNVPMRETVEIQLSILYGDQVVQKVIKCDDSYSFTKIEKLHIQPILKAQVLKKFLIQKIYYVPNKVPNTIKNINDTRIQINQNNCFKSLRKLGLKSRSTNKLQVHLHDRNRVIINKLKVGTLNSILDTFYGQYEPTKNILQLCAKKQLKNLIKQLQKSNQQRTVVIEIEAMLKEDLLSLLNKYIRFLRLSSSARLNNSTGKKQRELTNDIVGFLEQIDTKGLLKVYYDKNFRVNHDNEGYSHRLLISKNQYFTQKCLKILSYANQSPIHTNNSITQPKTDFAKKIAYQFISTLNFSQNLQNPICNSLPYYFSYKNHINYYSILMGLQTLWIVLKDAYLMNMFMQSHQHNKNIQMINGYIELILKEKKGNNLNKEELQIYTEIMYTALKIWNKVFQIAIVKNKHNFSYISLVTEHKHLLELSSTIQQINWIKNAQQQQLKQYLLKQEQSKQIIELITKQNNVNANLKIQDEELMKMVANIFEFMQKYYNITQNNGIFMLFYQTAKLSSWIIILGQQLTQKIIRFLIPYLGSACLQVSSISKSLLYIYLMLNPQINCGQLMNLLFESNGLAEQSSFNRRCYYQLLGQCFVLCQDKDYIQSVASTFLDKLAAHSQVAHSQQEDETIIQILVIIKNNAKKLSRQVCQTFIKISFKYYLFFNSTESKKFSPRIRKAIYQSLQACFRQHLQIQVEPYYDVIKQQINIANSVKEEAKPQKMGVGLENLGNICYMNSLLQLLFSIKPFVNGSCSLKTQNILIKGLQNLFLRLMKSVKKSISPEQFILSFEPPINVSLQQDTTQFLVSFLDKLENQDQSKSFLNLISDLLKGQTQSKIQCSQCKKSKHKTQDFILYSVSIQNQSTNFKNLQQCLQNTKCPQIVYDLNCDHCQTKRKFFKTTQLKTIPQYFIVNLKRLVFDYNNPLTKIKIHSRLQFPQILGLHGQKLILKAVITHEGTGQYGHYYTSVKQQNNMWNVYNDSRVYPLAQNAKQQIWYGGSQFMQSRDYSANAYVLLYQKQPQIKTSQPKSLQQDNPQLLAQIQKQNRSLLTKQFLFGQQYIKDFTNFIYNLFKLPKIPNNYLKIYEILASISYSYNTIPQITANQYFNSIQNTCNIQQLIRIVYEYKQNNLQIIFHKNSQIRQFFRCYLSQVFKYCFQLDQDSVGFNLALTYACEIVSKYMSSIKQMALFILSGDYTKLVAFLFRQINNRQQFSKVLQESNIINEILGFYISRILPIKSNYELNNTQLIQPLLQLLISYILVANNLLPEQIQSNFQTCKSNLNQIRKCLQQSDFLQLVFLSNSNSQYKRMILSGVELDRLFVEFSKEMVRDNNFLNKFVKIIDQYMGNWEMLTDVKIVRNLFDMMLYIYEKYYCKSSAGRECFWNTVMGYQFPYYQSQHKNSKKKDNNTVTDIRISNINNRSYIYKSINNKPSTFLQWLSNTMLKLVNSTKLQPDQLQIANQMLKFITTLLKLDQKYVLYFNNLCSPIARYADMYKFIQCSVDQLLKNIQLNTCIIMSKSPNIKQHKYTELKQQVNNISNIMRQKGMSYQNQESVVCGKVYKECTMLVENVVSQIFIRVEDYDYYLCGFEEFGESRLVNYVDKQGNLLQVYGKDEQLTKIFKQYQQQQKIQQQGINQPSRKTATATKKTPQDQLQIQQQRAHISHSSIRRKLIFTNISDLQQQKQKMTISVYVQCQNMKNKSMLLLLDIVGSESSEIWVQKAKVKEGWGIMKVGVNGNGFIIREQVNSQTYHQNSNGNYNQMMESIGIDEDIENINEMTMN